MTDKQIELLNGLEAYAQRIFTTGGQHAMHRSGTFMFEGVSVYYKKGRHPDVVTLKVLGDEFDCIIER